MDLGLNVLTDVAKLRECHFVLLCWIWSWRVDSEEEFGEQSTVEPCWERRGEFSGRLSGAHRLAQELEALFEGCAIPDQTWEEENRKMSEGARRPEIADGPRAMKVRSGPGLTEKPVKRDSVTLRVSVDVAVEELLDVEPDILS